MIKVALKKTPPTPPRVSIHVDKKKDPIAVCGSSDEAFEFIEHFVENEQTVHEFTVVKSRAGELKVLWTGVR